MRFSILTPSFNYARFLPAALDSVALQDPIHEQIVVDAGSLDGTVELLASRHDPNLHWISEPDDGQSDALNKAHQLASGDVVGWLNADEFYLPGAFAAVERAFAASPEVEVVFGDAVFVDEAGRLTRLVAQHPFSRGILRHRGCYLSTCSTFIRAETLEGFSWDPTLRTLMDWDMFLWLSSARFSYIPIPLAAFRLHAEQVTSQRLPRTSPEHQRLRQRYGIVGKSGSGIAAVPRLFGDVGHGALKMRAGGFRRERLARALCGESIDWTTSQAAEANAERLVRLIAAPPS